MKRSYIFKAYYVSHLSTSTLSTKAVLGVKAPISQSLTRDKTEVKLGLGDFDLARRPPKLIPLFRLAFRALAALAAPGPVPAVPPGLLVRFCTSGLDVTLGESGTVRFRDIPSTERDLK